MTRRAPTALPDTVYDDALTLWDYHVLRHAPRRSDVGIGLGSHDLGVAEHAAALFGEGRFELLVFTGATTPTTARLFPRGEAAHYRERALELGVPDDAILVEPHARNTGENIRFTRRLLADRGVPTHTATLVCKPYHQRRAYATSRRQWPRLDVRCSAAPTDLDEYLATIGDADQVVHMLVGETQRILVYARRGFIVAQDVPPKVEAAYRRLVRAGYVSRLVRRKP
ncbi:YdcF family protein [Saccharomonospora sp.]|uniref:YdcF family protein n=1 Tax=Saccharomonospora sp. TaxID=33913 RepID=UPI002608F3AB|nr:YdcF family protein [Saccharomonospora sp.]